MLRANSINAPSLSPIARIPANAPRSIMIIFCAAAMRSSGSDGQSGI